MSKILYQYIENAYLFSLKWEVNLSICNSVHRTKNEVPRFPADLVTFTEEILNGKLHFLCSGWSLRDHVIILFYGASFWLWNDCYWKKCTHFMVTKNSLLYFKHELYHYRYRWSHILKQCNILESPQVKWHFIFFYSKLWISTTTMNHIQSRRHPNNRPPPAPTHQPSNQKTPATPHHKREARRNPTTTRSQNHQCSQNWRQFHWSRTCNQPATNKFGWGR